MRLHKVFVAVALLTTFIGASAQPESVKIIAHRGCWNCPEGGYSHNSIASAKAAVAGGFFGSEFDVNMTADGKVMFISFSLNVCRTLLSELPYDIQPRVGGASRARPEIY